MAIKSGIYQIKCKTNNKSYVGSSINIMGRVNNHKMELRRNKHPNIYLQRAWNKYGENDFEIIILELVEIDDLIAREQYWLDLLKSYDQAIGFNLCKIAGSKRGTKMSDEQKQKLRELNLGEKNAFYGKKHSQETIERIRQAKVGKNKGSQNSFYRKVHSKEVIQQIKDANCVLTKGQAIEIKNLLKEGESQSSIARKFKVSISTIWRIKSGQTWTNI